MTEKTNNDLHILLVEQNGDIKAILSKIENLSKQFDKHETNDNTVHTHLHARISSLKKYGGAISIVCTVVGFMFGIKYK